MLRSDQTVDRKPLLPMEPATPVNEQTYQRLREEILSGQLAPGERLRFDKLSKAHSVSFTALREAFSRLAAEGLVAIESRKGARVSPINTDDFRDLLDVRLVIESECLGRSIACGGEDWEARVVAAFYLYSNALKVDGDDLNRDIETRIARHQQFHEALVSACDSARFMSLRALLAAQAQRYLALSFRTYALDPAKGAVEHERIMHAALERKTSLAVALLREDIMTAAEALLTAMDVSKSEID